MNNKRVEDHNDLCVGIDLGTTNSVLATVNLKPNGEIVSKVFEATRAVDAYNTMTSEARITHAKSPTLPSYVYYREENEFKPLVGDFAKRQYHLRPHLVSKSIKSQMGKSDVKNLSDDIPDKTPAQISSRILRHMIKEVGDIYRCEITDAVITVPANFDSAMCKATIEAAELAGIKTINSDGSERPILISEPNAVIYDLINQINNGEISNHILDLSQKKNVLVFDLGGGTLDITMHEISRKDKNKEILKVKEIATNRYTLLGGDDFDEKIANSMYENYLEQYQSYPDVVKKLKKDKKIIMSQLRVFAENLKLDLSERCLNEYSSNWDEDDVEIEIPVGGNMGGVGYAYDDSFKKEEIEEILKGFMGYELSFSDYKRIEEIKEMNNIIYPILDVLSKASEKIENKNVEVDAIIVNGGMSKFYMVIDRLKFFFGIDPIMALNPDQSVARGAAIYHYYLHKYDEMKNEMKKSTDSKSTDSNIKIEWGNNILNDSLYLGIKNGSNSKIISTGTELPYNSEVMKGFKIEPGQKKIAVPIKSRNLDGTYRTIANGQIVFNKEYADGAYISFEVKMDKNKIIKMKAWTSFDENGENKIEEGYVEIKIGNSENCPIKSKLIAPTGSDLNPKEQINNLIQLCKNIEKTKSENDKKNISKRIKICLQDVCKANNKHEFSSVIIDAFKTNLSEEIKRRLFLIIRKIGKTWSQSEREKASKLCIEQLNAEIHGLSVSGIKNSTNIQAILALSICGDEEQLKKLEVIAINHKYVQACLYTFSRARVNMPWILWNFIEDEKNILNRRTNNFQFSSYAIGMVLKNNGDRDLEIKEMVVKKICNIIRKKVLNEQELISSIIALGVICDQRFYSSGIKPEIIDEVVETIDNIKYSYYSDLEEVKFLKRSEIVMKIIKGNSLTESEEKFLISKVEEQI